MRKIVLLFICAAFMPNVTLGALGNTNCTIGSVYTSCNAGYYLSNRNCLACAKNTWKDTSGTATSCSSCGSLDGVAAQTASTGAKAQTSCYIAANTNLSDSTGTYQFTSNCFYKN